MYRYLSASQKKEIVDRIISGESVSAICKKNGISRTIAYKWVKEYKKTKDKKSESLFANHRPRGESHWRYTPGVREEVLRIVKQDPQLSPLDISKKLQSSKAQHAPSSYGVYSLLKKLKLNRYYGRLAFSEAAVLVSDNVARTQAKQNKVDLIAKTGNVIDSNLIIGLLIIFLLMFCSSITIYSIRSGGSTLPLLFEESKNLVNRINLIASHQSAPLVQKSHTKSIKGSQSYQPAAIFHQSIVTQPQEFSWGALVINSDKTVYNLNDQAHLSFGILDETGRTICYANLILKITDPLNKDTFLSLRGGTIHMRQGCGSFTHEAADYSAVYTPTIVGKYTMELIAETKNGAYSQKSSFIVNTHAPFSVEHEAPTRIYPPTLYPVILKIKANQDFTGEVRQVTSSDFTILPLSGTASYQIIQRDSRGSVLSWLVNIKKGEQIELGYLLQTPKTSPAAYALSGLSFTSGGETAFSENTGWNLVVDSVN